MIKLHRASFAVLTPIPSLTELQFEELEMCIETPSTHRVLTLTRRWVDPGIKTNFSQEDLENGGIALEKEQSKTIWHPDIYIYNLSDYKTLDDSIQVKNFFLRPFHKSVLVNSKSEKREDSNATVVEYTMEAKVKIYCNFHLSRYPMDSQVCKFRFGGRSTGIDFVLL